jgi:hypothetical protein
MQQPLQEGHEGFPAGAAGAALQRDAVNGDSCTGPYQARATERVLSVSVMRAMPTKAPGGSPKTRSKSARTSRS